MEWFNIIVPASLILFGAFFLIGIKLEQSEWRSTCIERGLAQYNPQTGVWEWLDTAQPTEAGGETTSSRS